MRRPWTFSPHLVLLLAVMSFMGCHLRRSVKPPAPTAMTVYQSPNLSKDAIRRVLVMPIDNQTSVPAAGPRFASLLVGEIRGARRFEVIELSHLEAGLVFPETDLRDGRYSETMLIDLRDTYNVDGLMFATLKDFYPYWPPRFSASMQLVDTSSGETVWSIDGVWDTRDEHVARTAQEYFGNSSVGRLIGDPELALQSPEYLGRFVANQMATALKNSWPQFVDEQPSESNRRLVSLTGRATSSPGPSSTAGEAIATPAPTEPPALPLPEPSG